MLILNVLDGSVSSLLEHCLGWRRDSEDSAGDVGGEERLAVADSPLLTYLHTSPRPSPSQVDNLARAQSSSPSLSPLHVLLTSPHLQPLHPHLVEVVSVLVDHDLATGPPSPLVSLGRFCELHPGWWGLTARLAQLLLTRTQCDVNSGTLSPPATTPPEHIFYF